MRWVLILFLSGCTFKPLSDIPVTENVTFEKDIQPIVKRECNECHWQGRFDFSKYDNAYLSRFQIRQRVAVDKSMPFGRFMSDKDRALFRDWVDQGAKK